MCRRVCPRSLSSLGCGQGIVVLVLVGFMRGRLVHWSAPWCLLDLYRDAEFTVVRPVVSFVHTGSMGSLGRALGLVGFVWFN